MPSRLMLVLRTCARHRPHQARKGRVCRLQPGARPPAWRAMRQGASACITGARARARPLLTRFCTRKLRFTALPWLIAERARLRKPCAKKVEAKEHTMPMSVNTRLMSGVGCEGVGGPGVVGGRGEQGSSKGGAQASGCCCRSCTHWPSGRLSCVRAAVGAAFAASPSA